jgi:hypothetical protein
MTSVWRDCERTHILVTSATLWMHRLVIGRCWVRALQTSTTSASAETLSVWSASHLMSLILVWCLIHLIEPSLSLILSVVLLTIRVLAIHAVLSHLIHTILIHIGVLLTLQLTKRSPKALSLSTWHRILRTYRRHVLSSWWIYLSLHHPIHYHSCSIGVRHPHGCIVLHQERCLLLLICLTKEGGWSLRLAWATWALMKKVPLVRPKEATLVEQTLLS